MLRGQKLDESYTEEKPEVSRDVKPTPGGALFDVEDDWGEGATDWGDDVTLSDVTGSGESDDVRADVNPTEGAVEERPDSSQNSDVTSQLRDMRLTETDACAMETRVGDASTNNATRVSYAHVVAASTDADAASDDAVERMSECSAEDVALEPESQILRDLLAPPPAGGGGGTPPEVADSRVELRSYFLCVMEEPTSRDAQTNQSVSAHERRLLAEYTRREGVDPTEGAPRNKYVSPT